MYIGYGRISTEDQKIDLQIDALKAVGCKLQNRVGKYVRPTLDSVTAAASTASQLSEDLRDSITNGNGSDSYPIVGYTYIIIWQDHSIPYKVLIVMVSFYTLALFLRYFFLECELVLLLRQNPFAVL